MVYTISGIQFPLVPSGYKSSQSSFHGDRRSTTLSYFLKKEAFSRKTVIRKFSHDSDSASSMVAASDEVLVPGVQENASSSTEQNETPEVTSGDPQDLTMKSENIFENDEAVSGSTEAKDGQSSVLSSLVDDKSNAQAVKASVSADRKVKIERNKVKPKIIPPPGSGQKIYEIDPLLLGHRDHLDFR